MKTCYICGREYEDKDIMLEGESWDTGGTIYACKVCTFLYGNMQFNVPPTPEFKQPRTKSWVISKTFVNE